MVTVTNAIEFVKNNFEETNKYYSKEDLINRMKKYNLPSNFDEYLLIYKFILEKILTKYDELISSHISFEDGIGNQFISFYIRYDCKLTFETSRKIKKKITREIYEFCKDLNIIDAFYEIPIFFAKEVWYSCLIILNPLIF